MAQGVGGPIGLRYTLSPYSADSLRLISSPLCRDSSFGIAAGSGLKQAKGLISGPWDLLKLNRDQLRWVVGLLTGHCHLKGHFFSMGLTDDPTCERCLEEDESATHILCDCEAIANLRFRILGQFLWS
jgi:hypothetical protein